MEFLTPVQDYIQSLDQKQFKTYTIVFFVCLLVSIGFIGFYYFRSVSWYKTQLIATNKKRRHVQELLARYELVKRQQKEVDALLAKEKDFKITQFFQNLLDRIGIAKIAKSIDTRSEDVLDNYTEWTLEAHLTPLNMKKFTELLNALENENRVYIKDIEITSINKAVDVKLAIATLEQKPQTTIPE